MTPAPTRAEVEAMIARLHAMSGAGPGIIHCPDATCDEAAAMLRALAEAPVVPSREPTAQMFIAGTKALAERAAEGSFARFVWYAMYDAAPSVALEPPPEPVGVRIEVRTNDYTFMGWKHWGYNKKMYLGCRAHALLLGHEVQAGTCDEEVLFLFPSIVEAQLDAAPAIAPLAEPVAWLHTEHRSAYVITDRVKDIWLRVDPKHVEHYTIPLYAGNKCGDYPGFDG